MLNGNEAPVPSTPLVNMNKQSLVRCKAVVFIVFARFKNWSYLQTKIPDLSYFWKKMSVILQIEVLFLIFLT